MCCATLIPTFLLLCLTSYFNKEEEERSDDEAVASIETESQKDKQLKSHLEKRIMLSSSQRLQRIQGSHWRRVWSQNISLPAMVSGPAVPGVSVTALCESTAPEQAHYQTKSSLAIALHIYCHIDCPLVISFPSLCFI